MRQLFGIKFCYAAACGICISASVNLLPILITITVNASQLVYHLKSNHRLSREIFLHISSHNAFSILCANEPAFPPRSFHCPNLFLFRKEVFSNLRLQIFLYALPPWFYLCFLFFIPPQALQHTLPSTPRNINTSLDVYSFVLSSLLFLSYVFLCLSVPLSLNL